MKGYITNFDINVINGIMKDDLGIKYELSYPIDRLTEYEKISLSDGLIFTYDFNTGKIII